MTIIVTPILFWPLAVVLWAVDSFLFAICVRVTIGRYSTPRTNRYISSLKTLTDGPWAILDSWIARYRGRAAPAWASWTALLAGLLVIRALLFLMMRAAF